MRWAASPNACAEAPRLLTLAAGRGAWRAGEGLGSCSGRPSGASWVHRRLWSVRRRGARQLRRVRRRAGRCRPHARLPRRSVPRGALERWSVGALERWSVGALERWSVGALERRGPGRCFGRPVRWLRELGVLPRRPFRPRPRTLPAPGSAPHVPLRFGLGAPQGFVRRRDGRASVDEGTAVADTRSAARRAASALLARACGLPLAGSHPRRPLRTWLLFWSGGSASACDSRQLS